MHRSYRLPLAAFAVAVALSPQAWSQSTWTGGGADNNWSTPANWSLVPGNPSANFVNLAGGIRLTPTVDAPWTIRGLIVSNNAGAFILSGSPLTLSAQSTAGGTNVFEHKGATNVTIANDLILQTTTNATRRNFLINGAGGVIFSGLITNTGPDSSQLWIRGTGAGIGTLNGRVTIGSNKLFKADAGTWVIGAANNQWGPTEIDGTGTLRIAVANALPTNTTVAFSNSNPRLDLNNFNQAVLGMTGTGVVRTGTGGGGRLTIADAGGETTFSGNIVENGTLYKAGTGSFNLAANTTFTGAVTVAEGTLRLAAGGRLSNSVAKVITVSNGAVFAISNINAIAATHAVVCNAPIIVQQGGTLKAEGRENRLGNITLDGGTLLIDGGSTNYGSFYLPATLSVGGTSPSIITNTAAAGSWIPLGTATDFNVADATASATADLEVFVPLHNVPPLSAPTAGGFTKRGAGTMLLHGGHALSGTVTVTAGTLALAANGGLTNAASLAVGAGARFDVSALPSGYAIPPMQILFGHGTVTGSVQVAAGARIHAGAAGSAGTLTVEGDLLLDATVTNVFDLTNNTAVAGGNDLLVVSGTQFEPSNALLQVNTLAPLTSGTYRLVNYTGTKTTTFAAPVLGNTTRGTWTLDESIAGQIDLKVTATNEALRWSAFQSSDWDLTTTNWTALSPASPSLFFEGDSVRFDDDGGDSNVVNIVTQVKPAAVVVDSTSNYVFVGAGGLADPLGGAATLLKAGAGSLTIATTNTWSGGTIISNGSVQIGDGGNAGTLGTGPVQIGAGTTLSFFRDNVPYTNVNALSGPGSLVLIGSGGVGQGNYVVTGINTGFTGNIALTNARLVADNANDLGAASSISLAGNASVFQSAGSFGRPLSLAGLGWPEVSGQLGALRIENATWSGPVTLTADARIGAFLNNGTVSGVISGPYELELWAGSTARSLTLAPTNRNAYASLRISSNMIAIAGNTNALGTGPLIMNGGMQRLAGFSFAISNLSDTAAGGTIVNQHGSSPATLTIGLDDSSTTYGGKFANPTGAAMNVTKVGLGALTLTGTNLNTGTFTVQAGTLALGASGSISNAAVLALAGGTFDVSAKGVYTPLHLLRGNGTVTGTLAGAAGSRLVAGDAGVVGTLVFANDVGLDPAATSSFDVVAGPSDQWVVAGNLEPSNSLLTVNALSIPLPNGTYTLLTYGGSKTSVFTPNLAGNLTRKLWAIDEAVSGQVNLVVSGDIAPLQWMPQTNANWDLGTSNWLNTASSETDRFFNADAVLFDDAGAYSNVVNLTSVLLPASIVVESTSNYTFAGTGRLGGTMGLDKGGSGRLLIQTTNNYSGLVRITNGTLALGASGALGSTNAGTRVSGSGTLDINGTTNVLLEAVTISGQGVDGNGALVNNGVSVGGSIPGQVTFLTLSGDASVGGTGNWDIRNNSGSIPASIDLGGFTLTKKGANLLQFVEGRLTNGGNLIVESGTLLMRFTNSVGGAPVTIQTGATLRLRATIAPGWFTQPLTLNSGRIQLADSDGVNTLDAATIFLTGSNRVEIDTGEVLTLTGSLAGSGESLNRLGGGLLVLKGSNTYSGPTILNNGTINSLASSNGSALAGPVQIGHLADGGGTGYLYTSNQNQFASGVVLSFKGSPNDWAWMKLFGTTQYVASVVTDDNGGGVMDHVYQEPGYNIDSALVLTGPGDSYWSGSYLRDSSVTTSVGRIQLVQAGTGTLTLAGGRANTTFTGGVVVNSGVLNVKSAYAAGRGPITLAGGLLALDAAGLKEDIVSGAFNAASSNSVSSAVKLSPVRIDTVTDMGTNTQYSYTGYIVNTAAVPVAWTFAEQFDDNSYLKIGDTLVLNDTTAVGRWTNATLGTITLQPGLHAFDLRCQNSGGQGGASTNFFWTNRNFAVGIDFQGLNTSNQDLFQRIVDPGDGSLLVTDVQVPNAILLLADSTVRVSSAWGPTNAIQGAISGNYGLTKSGAGSLRLTGTNAYAGPTLVEQGKLYLDGVHAAAAAMTVASNALLWGTGSATGAVVTVQPGGRLGPESVVATGTLTLAELHLGTGVSVGALLNGTNPTVRVSGNLTTLPSLPLRVLPVGPVTLGTNVLLKYGGSYAGSVTDFVLAPLPNGAQGDLVHNPTDATIELVITNAGFGLRWDGLVDSQWRSTTPQNWKLVETGTPAGFTPFDAVLFDDAAAANYTVAVAEVVSPGSITFSNDAKDYAVGGSAIAGPAGILKLGAAKVSLTSANSFTGATVIGAGTLAIASDLGLGTVPTAAVAGQLRIGGGAALEITGNTTLAANRGIQIGPESGAGTSIVAVAAGVTATTASVLADRPGATGRLAKAGGGTLSLASTVTFSGGAEIEAGRLLLSGATNRLPILSRVDVGANGILDLGGQNQTLAGLTGFGVVTNSAGTLTLWMPPATTSTFAGSVDGTFGLVKGGAVDSLLELRGTNSFTGGVNIQTGLVLIANSLGLGVGTKTITFTLGGAARPGLLLDGSGGDIVLGTNITFTTSSSIAFGITNLAGNNTILGSFNMTSGGGDTAVRVNGGTLTLAGTMNITAASRNLVLGGPGTGFVTGRILSGTISTAGVNKVDAGIWTLTGTNAYSGITQINGGLLQIGNGGTAGNLGTNTVNNAAALSFNRSDVFTNVPLLTGTGTVIQAGSGALVLHRLNGYSGPTFVSNGTLQVRGSIGSGPVSLSAGARLSGTGAIGGAVTSDGVVAPGTSIGILSMGQDFTQNAAGVLDIEIGGLNPGSEHDRLDVGGVANLGGTLNVTLTNLFTPSTNDIFIVLAAGSLNQTFAATNMPALTGGDAWVVTYSGGFVYLTITNVAGATGYDLAALAITNASLRGYQEDADADGYANLLEYATGGSLTNADATAKMSGVRSNGVLALRFSRDTNAIDATMVVEGSYSAAHGAEWLGIATNSGGSWGAGTNVVTSGTNSPVSETVFDAVTATNRFLRLRVTRP